MGILQSAAITTVAGRIPNVQLSTQYPANSYFIDFRDPNNPNEGGTESVTPIPQFTEHMAGPYAGGFALANENESDGNVTDPTSEYYDANLNFAPYAYAWI